MRLIKLSTLPSVGVHTLPGGVIALFLAPLVPFISMIILPSLPSFEVVVEKIRLLHGVFHIVLPLYFNSIFFRLDFCPELMKGKRDCLLLFLFSLLL